MRRKITITILLVIGAILLYSLFIGGGQHHRTAADYERVLSKTNVKLPEIANVESWDNYDRGASRWDCLEHRIVFKTPLSEKSIKKMERLCARKRTWVKDEMNGKPIYIFRSEEEWNSDLYYYSCRISETGAYIEYYIDEDEGLFAILICIPLLFIWLIVFIIVLTAGPKVKKNKIQQ